MRDMLSVPAGTTSDVPDDQKLTVFAPINAAFRGNDFGQDLDTKAKVSRLQKVHNRCFPK